MIFDTHAHLNLFEFEEDREELIEKCLAQGMGMINVGTNFKSSEKCIEIAGRYFNVFASIGLHPTSIAPDFLKSKECSKTPEGFLEAGFDYEAYKKLAKSKKVVAIGECGLDYKYQPKEMAKRELFKEEQKKILLKQLDLAEELNLPVIIHCRQAFDDLFSLLSKRKIKGVLHCFTGTKAEAERFLSLGLYFGLNGIIFREDLEEAIKNIPLEKILLETDCPYLSPPIFEERNNPLSLKYIIKEIARIKEISVEEIEEATYKNAKKLFDI
jgi:TatD DNase family protein